MNANSKLLRITSKFIINKINEADNLYKEKNYKEAIKLYEKTLKEISDKYAFDKFSIHNKISNCYKHLDNIEKQIEHLEKTTQYCSVNPQIWFDLANLCNELYPDKHCEYLSKAFELKPDMNYLRNLAFATIINPKYKQKDIKNKLEHYIDLVRPMVLKDKKPYTHSKRDKNKKLKIAYMSSDFHSHAMMCFVLPLLENHNTKDFDITLYCCNKKQDEVTQRIKNTGANFKDCSELNCEELAEEIYNDEIDILIDLGGYTHDKIYTLLFKPAPIQIQYLGFVGTYGIKEVDYIFADEFTIPKEVAPFYTEKPLYIKSGLNRHTFTHHNTELPEIPELPCLTNGYITFGCFNGFYKISNATIKLWAKVLKAVENSKLLIYRFPMVEKAKKRIIREFQAEGIDLDRIIFDDVRPEGSHFYCYAKCDIALDTIPYNGLTISIETMLMGVPVLTLNTYDTFASKGAGRINKIIKLNSFVTDSEEDFINKALLLANNIEILKLQRKTLRTFIQNSPLCCEHLSYAQEIESLYTKIWKEYCDKD